MAINNLKTIGERVKCYITTYRNEIDNQLMRYASIPTAFPDYLKNPQKVIAILGRDGIIVAYYKSDQDLFEFTISTQTTADLIFNMSGVNIRFNFHLGMEFIIENLLSRNLQKDEKSQLAATLVGVSPWEKLLRTADLSLPRWSETRARQEASNEVARFVTAQLLELKKENVNAVFDKLEETLSSFAELLDSDPKEEEVQQFLAVHPVLLAPSAVRVIPKHPLGAEYKTDFVIEMADKEYVFVEIERPGLQLFNKKGDQRAELTHAIGQVEDWREWMSEHISYARNGLPEVTVPACWVIIGRRIQLSDKERKRLRRRNRDNGHIKILTYDDLIDQARRFLKNLRQFSNTKLS